MRLIIRQLIIILGLMFSSLSHADVFEYSLDKQGVNLHDHAQLLISSENARFPTNYQSVELWAKQLKPLPSRALFSGRYWLVTQITNKSSLEKLVLYPYNTVVDRIESRIYSDKGDIQRYFSGGKNPNEFAFHYGNTIELKPNTTYYLVTSFESEFFYTPTKLVMKPVKDFNELVIKENLLMTLCFSVGIILGLYNLLIYIGSKDATHLYFALFAGVWVFSWSHFFHIPDQLFGFYSAHLHWLGFSLAPITNILFYNSLLKLKDKHPNLSITSIWLGIISALGLPFCILFPGFGFLWATVMTGSALCLGMYIGVLRVLDGFKPARYFVLAYIAMMVPNMIGNLTNLGILPASTLNLYLLGLVGTALDALLLAFAVADKFRLTNEENIELNKNLEGKVLKRTYELEQLASQLRDASESKSRFLANMSHEIRTPMTSIIGYADGIILGDITPQERNHAINVILQNSRHVLGLINDILDMSKIEANRLEIELMESNLFKSIMHVESLLGKQIRDKGLEFDLKYHFPLPDNIVIDPTRLRQILLNLTSNALKFTSVGKITIDVACSEDVLKISVTDTGIGMTSTEQKELFSAFYQADSSTSRKYGGTGLGLNISKSLANKLNGDISVESEVGSGTVFTLTLGLFTTDNTRWVNSLEEASISTPINESVIEAVNTDLKGDVLLAEDHSDNSKLIQRILERMGLKVTAVENGQQAVQAVLENEYDLILMDIQMPVMDGEQALTFIQATGCSAPILALTANTMQHEVERYIKLGFTDHLAKPIDRAEFSKKISHYLNISVVDEIDIPNEEFDLLKNKYISGLYEQKVQLQNQLKYHDLEGLSKSIHAIKGTAGMFECFEIQNLASKVDGMFRGNYTEDEIVPHIEELVAVIEHTIASSHQAKVTS
ncbi:response regulator [Pseudoalteromonas sp. JBTF-M23]|uniref:histidine kinase n=1 Tax=Pseudoalteromonas caenipelagi TaxID=2726988 RepID=A0A849VBZ6_9GAMM|nr:ATP-binding protein [Pseudoalteromonas caenipelagi]NOU49317.1 response regulator [Pseudoalteromonas caenipelagi]